MNDVANAVLSQINLAGSEGIPLLHVQRAVNLLSFLRKSDATMHCLDRIAHLRTYVPSELFNPHIANVRDEITNCISIHCFLDGITELKLIRRLNCLRLKEALNRLDPDERRAKACLFFEMTDPIGNNERTFRQIFHFKTVGKGVCSCFFVEHCRWQVW